MGDERSVAIILSGSKRAKASKARHQSGQPRDPQRHERVDRRRVHAPRREALGRRCKRVQTREVQGRYPWRVQSQDGVLAFWVWRENVCWKEFDKHGVQDCAILNPL